MAPYPKHVNHDLSPMACPAALEDVDLFGEGAQEHWYEAYEILHRDEPVLRIEGGGLSPGSDAFVLTKHHDISRVVKDPKRFRSVTTMRVGQLVEKGLSPEDAYAQHHNLMQASMVSLRPTQELYFHHRRELTDPWVGTGALRHREMITAHANDLIDEWIGDDEVEFIGRFARPLPQRIMASILGFPQDDIPQLAAWGDATVTPFVHGTGLKHDLTREQAADMNRRLEGFQDYIYDHVAAKRADPQDDMVSFLCDVHYRALDRTLTDIEIAGIVHAMIIGGLETTQYALEEQAQLLCETPGTFATLRTDRSRLRSFVEEALRMRAPTHGLSTRMTTEDELFHEVLVPAGSLLHMRFGAANVDPDEFDCPFDLDLDRESIARHLTFSTGPRVCPGATLSRLEQQVAWGALLDRLESIEYGDGNDWMHQPGIMLGTLRLNLRFRAADEALSLGTGR
ncbi:cytochrome P450 [Ilumatobacter nonamiensis]|uniref:cytochrome P450 n=1 Tax=Ilumatobacter nonamiensis TaxID=467093 RepID=UPI00058D658A|nr:cytochrome P450 [Ilumatobacter nonamiensis]